MPRNAIGKQQGQLAGWSNKSTLPFGYATGTVSVSAGLITKWKGVMIEPPRIVSPSRPFHIARTWLRVEPRLAPGSVQQLILRAFVHATLSTNPEFDARGGQAIATPMGGAWDRLS